MRMLLLWIVLPLTLFELKAANADFLDQKSHVRRVLRQAEGNSGNQLVRRFSLRHGDEPVVRTQVIEADFNHRYTESANRTLEFIYHFVHANDSSKAVRVSVESQDVTLDHPILFVVRQQKSVNSWQLPHFIDTASGVRAYHRVERTLCPEGQIVNSASDTLEFVLGISTSDPRNVSFTLKVTAEEDFVIGLNEERRIVVTPSEPRFYQYAFDDNVTAVLVNVTSPDHLCMTVSVQNLTCPLFEADEELRYDSVWQTALDRSGLTVTREKFPLGFYLVFSVKADDYECSGKKDNQIRTRRKEINFRITQKLKPLEFYAATLGVIGVFALFYVLGIVIWIIHCITSGPAPPLERSLLEAEDQQRYGTSTSLERPVRPARNREGKLLDSGGSQTSLWRSHEGGTSVDSRESSLNLEDVDMLEDAFNDKEVFRTKTFLYVSDLARKDHKYMSRRFYSYIWQLLTITTFYALPVLQLVITYQKVLNDTGDQDLCYYNFLCAHPYGKLTDFNHVFSNVGYIMLGVLFCILVFFRDIKHKTANEQNTRLEKYYGIPQYYGLYYAMGVSLIVEGVMSACYHICPTHANYQFDTTFMYVIAILCMLKIYQTRHPDIVATPQASFGVLAFAVIAGVISVYESSVYFWVAYAVIHVMVCLALSANIYYMGRWKLDLGIFKRIYLTWLNDIRAGLSHCFRPMYPDRMILLVLGNLINWALAFYGLYTRPPDFASYQLAIFITNLMLYTLFYIVMKIRYGEKIMIQALIYITLSLVSWGGSFYFFIVKAATWRMSAAESRHYNQECLLLNFYDYHDIWHFLSASSMFFSFMILLSLDDDQVYRPRDKIPVF